MPDPTKESTREELDRIMRETKIPASVARIMVRANEELRAERDALRTVLQRIQAESAPMGGNYAVATIYELATEGLGAEVKGK